MNRQHLHRVFAVAAIVAFAACSSHTPLLPSGDPQSVSQDQTQSATSGTQKVEVVIDWSASRHAARSPKFTSPSAQSVRVDISGSASTTIVERPARASTSTTAVLAPVGDDTFTFTVFDQPYGEGNELGGATVKQRVKAGTASTIHATFAGYAASFEVTPSDSRFRSSSYTVGGIPVYTVSGQAQIAFLVAAKDVDGNVILSPGAPKITASSDAPTVFRVRPVKGHASTFTVQAVGQTLAGSNPHLVIEAPGAGGTTSSESFPLSETSLLYAAVIESTTPHIYAFDTLGKQYTLPGTFAGIVHPVALAHDNLRARIYVADAGASKLLAFDENGNAISGWKSPTVSGINGVASDDSAGDVYASTSANGGGVDIFDGSGAPVTSSGAFAGQHAPPVGIAYDPNSRIFAVAETNGSSGYVDVFSEQGTLIPSDSSTLIDSVYGVPFIPVGINVSEDLQGLFWLSGSESYNFPPSEGGSGTDPMMTAYIPYATFKFQGVLTAENGATLDGFYTNGLITSPLGVAINPSMTDSGGDFYLWQATGPLLGFTCSVTSCINNPIQRISGVPSEVPTIRASKPGSTFTAAVFSEF